MYTNVFETITIGLAGLLGLTSALAYNSIIEGTVLPAQNTLTSHQGVDFALAHDPLVKRGTQLQVNTYENPPTGPVYRCHDPHPEVFGPAPPIADCDNVIKQFTALPNMIDVKLDGGCYQIVSGNCTGLVCPQREGEVTVTGAVAAQYMTSPLRDNCIANGQRGWWMDGRGLGFGVYLV